VPVIPVALAGRSATALVGRIATGEINAFALMSDLKARLAKRVQLTTDEHKASWQARVLRHILDLPAAFLAALAFGSAAPAARPGNLDSVVNSRLSRTENRHRSTQ
jgi:hypothetical protein